MIDEILGQQTATRATLDLAWQESRAKIDWMHAPEMANYVNGLVSSKSLADGGHWALYIRDKYLRSSGHPLSMISLGCGSGHIEKSLIVEFGWPIHEMIGLEYDSELRRAAQETFKTIPVKSEFEFFDFDRVNLDRFKGRVFDIVFACHALHHAENIEGLLQFVNSLLGPTSRFIGIDYFGPTRFQIEPEAMEILRVLDSILPSELKRDLRETDPHPRAFRPPSIADVTSADRSEAIRSSDLRTLLFATFPILETKPMGGTLLRWLLQYRAGNFSHANELHVTISRLLQFIERMLIDNRTLKSDDLCFVLSRSEVL